MMKLRRVVSTLLYFVFILFISPLTVKTLDKENNKYVDRDTNPQARNSEFRGFYEETTSFHELRKQRLYEVRAQDRRNIISSSTPVGDLTLSFNLPFFGFRFTKIWIHLDGYLSSSHERMGDKPPVKFPVKRFDESGNNDPSIIAPWLSRHDIPSSLPESGVYIRLVTIKKEPDDMLRERLKLDFREGMIGAVDFVPSYALIVTWRNVTFANRPNTESFKTNTFQVVLATDELRTYAMFNYDNIEWLNQGYNGMKAVSPFVGFNGGNRTRVFELKPYSQSPRIGQIMQNGYANNIKGRWIFQVDEEIWPGSCINTDLDPDHGERGRLTFFPQHGNMLGGAMVNVTGPCFESDNKSQNDPIIFCKFHIFVVPAIYRDINHASCFQPFLPSHGYVDLSVSINHGAFKFVGSYYIEPPEMGREDIIVLNHADISEYPTSMMITWHPKSLTYNGEGKANLHLWGYRKPDHHTRIEGLTFIDTLVNAELIVGNGRFELDPIALQKRRNYDEIDMEFGFLSINLTTQSNATGTRSSMLWSRPMPLAWYFRPQWERKYKDKWRSNFCTNWAKNEGVIDFTNRVISCPCTLSQAQLDVGRFIPDSSCHDINKDCEIFHKGATHCVRSGGPSESGYGHLCCYDNEGELMRTTDTIYGSRPSTSHLFGSYPYNSQNYVPTLSHWQEDTMPFFFCCKWGGGRNDGLCKLYNERRKSDDCLSYQAPGVASVIGDPHFNTFDGMTYTFNGKGEFVLVRSSGSVEGLDIQARFEQPIRNKGEKDICATKLTAIVARVDNSSSLVEFRVRPEGASWRYRTFLIVDGEYRHFRNDNNYLMFRGVTIYQKMGIYNMSHIIALFHSGVGVEIVNNDGNLAANIYLPKSYLNNVLGLLGKWSGSILDDFTLPDNQTNLVDTSTDEKIHYNFAMEWRVTEIENDNVGRSLFNHNVIPFEIFDDVNFKPNFADEIFEELQQSKVQEVCGDSFMCAYDFLLTGDKNYALMSGRHERRTEIIRNGLEVKVIRCPSLPAPSNGKKSSLRVTPGTIIEIRCDEGYRLIGESKKICQGNGTWTEGSSRCVLNRCPPLPIPKNGRKSNNQYSPGKLVRFRCNEGYTLVGESFVRCEQNGTWTGASPSCVPREPSRRV